MHSSSTSRLRGGHLAIGLALLVMGCALLVIAFARQSERARAMTEAANPACVGPPDATHGLISPPQHLTATPTTSSLASDPFDANEAGHSVLAPTIADFDSAARRAADAAADAELDVGGGQVFAFLPGTVAMTKEERQRLFSLGIALSRQPDLRLTVEGYGDQAGGDPATVALARHRAKIGQIILSKAGVAEARVSVASADADADARLLRSIRVTAGALPSEGGQP